MTGMTALLIVIATLTILTAVWLAVCALFTYCYSERGRAKGDREYIEREVAAKRAREEANGDHPVRI